MNENLTNQIVTALQKDGTVKMSAAAISAAISPAVAALPKEYLFRGVATLDTTPGKIFTPTLFVAVAGGWYDGFSRNQVDEGEIRFYTSDDGQEWASILAYSELENRLHALEGEDLSMFDAFGNPLEKRSTANCYVVRKAGRYRIPLIYGNGIKNGAVNAAAYTRQGSTNTADFVNHLGNKLTSPYIEENAGCVAASAGLLWQTSRQMIYQVVVSAGQLVFDIDDIPATNGLAVLYVKDANGDIIWSWMIWAVNDSLESFKLKNHTDVEYEMMGLPLGAIWDAAKQHYVVPHYQWGRKDPMAPAKAYNSTTNIDLFDIEGNAYTGFGNYGVADDADAGGTTRSVANGIKMPEKFFLEYDATKYNWNNLDWFNNFWNAAITASGDNDDNQATAIKTIYDPCPVGWMLPAARFATGFTTTGTNSSDASEFNVIGSFANGYTFKKDTDDAEGVFFPAAGYRYRTSGALGNVGSGGYWWTFAPNSQTNARYLYFYSGSVNPLYTNYRAYGCGVWPCRELS